MQIDQFQGITLYAFFEAIAQQTTPLPEDLQQQMSAVAELFSTDTDSAIDRLDAIAQHSILQPAYKIARLAIQDDYKPIELQVSLVDPEDPDQEPKDFFEEHPGNIIAILGSGTSPNQEQVLKTKRGILEWLLSSFPSVIKDNK